MLGRRMGSYKKKVLHTGLANHVPQFLSHCYTCFNRGVEMIDVVSSIKQFW